MEYKLFSLSEAQKKGVANTTHTINFLIGGLLVVVLIAVLAGTIFSYAGTGTNGLGNATANPSAPTWLSPLVIVIVAIGLVYMILKAFGITGK